MALPDPQIITISGTANTLPRISSAVNSGIFRSNDGLVKETVSHTYGRRNRHLFKVDFNKIAPDPLISSTNVMFGMSAHLVVDVPITGFTVAEQKAVVDGLLAQLSATSGALITKVLGGEN